MTVAEDKTMHDDEMSMEEILASIKKYVSPDEGIVLQNNSSSEESYLPSGFTSRPFSVDSGQGKVIELTGAQIVRSDADDISQFVPKSSDQKSETKPFFSATLPRKESNEKEVKKSTTSRPFEKLSSVVNGYEKNLKKQGCTSVFEQFFAELALPEIKKWIENNMPQIVEKMVEKEIEKIKSGE
jgi:cell pole-organizing protein PopZ